MSKYQKKAFCFSFDAQKRKLNWAKVEPIRAIVDVNLELIVVGKISSQLDYRLKMQPMDWPRRKSVAIQSLCYGIFWMVLACFSEENVMREKYFVRHHAADEEMLLGLYRDADSVVCGGSILWLEECRAVLGCFSAKDPDINRHKRSHRHKQTVRGVTGDQWRSGLKELTELGYMLSKTRSFRRLMT